MRLGFISLIVWMIFMASGCMVSMDDNRPIPVPEDIGVWSQSAEKGQGIIVLSSDITRASATDVTRKIIALDSDPIVSRIRILINSNGGETSAFRTIYNAMRFTSKPVDTVNVGNCYSAACAIFASATGKRYAFNNTHFMVHKPRINGGNARRYEQVIDFETNIYEDVLRQGGLPRYWFPIGSGEHYFTAQQAKEFGFVDDVVTQLP